MNQSIKKRLLAVVVCVSMLIGNLTMIPTTVQAEESDFVSETHTVFSSQTTNIAPGVTQQVNYAYANDGNQMVYFVAKADINREDVNVQTTYKNAQTEEYGMQILREQMEAAKEKHSDPEDKENYIPYYTPVAGVNGDFFNTSTGQPSGAFVMEGVQVSSKANNRPWFAIFEDGTALCGKNNTEWDAAVELHGAVQEAVGGSQMLVVDGEDVTATATGSYNTDRHCRTMVGVTADGEVVMVVLDGRQEPYSCGGTMHELAQIMLEQGCVTAINLDGGGSTTYVARPEGEDEVVLVNRPSDGSERSISSGLMIVSTAVPSNTFEYARLVPEAEYITPGSEISVSAKGISPAGTAADIPEGVTWKATKGTIENGVFTSDGTTGDATISMVYNGEVVGETTVHVVIPDKIQFNQAALTVPFGESVSLEVTATYGLNEVRLSSQDIHFTLEDSSIGTITNNIFTAADSGTSTNITVTLLHDSEVTHTVELRLGKGSEVAFDFEEGTEEADLTNWEVKDHEGKYAPYANATIVNSETGQVHSGKQALAFNMPMDENIHGTEMYAAQSLTWLGDPIVLENAVSLGFWVYIPKEATQTEIAVNYVWYDANGTEQRVTPDACLNDDFNDLEDSGWHYLSVPISKDMAYIKDAQAVQAAQGYKRNFFLKFYVTNSDGEKESSYMGDITYYIDDVTIDYSEAVEDREEPVFADLRYADETMSDAASLNGQTTKFNQLSFAAIVHEDTTKTNYTGLDYTTAKAYVDGVEVDCNASGGIMSIPNIELANGVHSVRFSICDKIGNYATISRKINVDGESTAPSVKVVAQDQEAEQALTGSVYYLDVVADDVEKVDSIQMKLDLDTMHTWELDYMDVLSEFDAKYFYETGAEKAENIVTIELTRVESATCTGSVTVASLPIRVWSFVANDEGKQIAPATAWTSGNITAVSVNVAVEKGVVSYVDETSHSFSSADIHIDTEAYTYYTNMVSTAEGKAYHTSHTYHVHEAVAIDDKKATCTEDGYTGRTFCEGCASVVEWGTIEEATGHTYEVTDGVLKCACGKLFNGEQEGLTYVDGVLAEGWVEDSYYVAGVKYTGLQVIDGYYYDFGENGVCTNKAKINGFYYDEEKERYMYFVAGTLSIGDCVTEDGVSFFDSEGYSIEGVQTILGYTCYFEKGKFAGSDQAEVVDAGYSGTNIQYVFLSDGTLKVGGSGAIKDYTSNGIYPAWIINNKLDIKKVEIGKDITRIGKFSFFKLEKMTTLVFESGSALKEIGWGGFGYCYKLQGVTIPASVELLDAYAFYYNHALLSVDFEEGSKLKEIGMYAFWNDTALGSVYIPDDVETFGDGAFYKATRVTLSVLDGSAAHLYAVDKGIAHTVRQAEPKVIANGACGENATWEFYNTGLLVIGGSGEMADYAVKGTPWEAYRTRIKEVQVGKDITKLGKFAFMMCENLETVEFEEGSTLETIGWGTFGYCTKLEEIEIPASVTTIAEYAFYFDSALKTVTFEEGSQLKEIGMYAFWNDTALESMYLGDDVKTFGEGAFYKADNVTLSVLDGSDAYLYAVDKGIAYTVREAEPKVLANGTCGENATWEFYNTGLLVIGGSGEMADYAVKGTPWEAYRTRIKEVQVGKDITKLGKFAFMMCENLETVEFEEGSALEIIGWGTFGYCTKLEEIEIPASVTTIAEYAFYFDSALKTVTFEEGSQLKEIGMYAFWNDTALESMYLGDDVETFGEGAFYKADSVTLSVLEGSTAYLYAVDKGIAYTVRQAPPKVLASGTCGENATWEFYNTGLLVIGGNGEMADYAVKGTPWEAYRTRISTVQVGKDITKLGKFAFMMCENLETVEFEEGSALETIGWGTFGYCTKLEAIEIPASVTTIAEYAFYFSDALKTVTFEEGSQLKEIGMYAFWNTTSLTEMNNIPQDVSLGDYAFYKSGYSYK